MENQMENGMEHEMETEMETSIYSHKGMSPQQWRIKLTMKGKTKLILWVVRKIVVFAFT